MRRPRGCRSKAQPHHPAGSAAIKLAVFSYLPATGWRPYKVVSLKVRDHNGYSTYGTVLLLKERWREWKVQAVHDDGDHAATVSLFSSVATQ